MPFNPAQTRLFLAAAHNPDIAQRHGLSTSKARSMAMESPPSVRSQAMKQSARARALRRQTPSVAEEKAEGEA